MARYDLSDAEWRVIEPLLPQKSRGVARVDRHDANYLASVKLASLRIWMRFNGPVI